MRTPLLAAILATLAGCSADEPLNPSFPLTVAEARSALDEMKRDPKPVERPIVIALGWLDPGFSGLQLGMGITSVLRQRAEGELVFASLSFVGCHTFEDCRQLLVNQVERNWPSSDPDATVEVDVIGVSMGGLVARFAAFAPAEEGKRLRIRRLFTIATPHRGAALAGIPTLDSRVIDMRAGSPFLARLDESLHDSPYELLAYVRLGDAMVGAANAAAPMAPGDPGPPEASAVGVWWVANLPFQPAHLGAASDPRILADIFRRLRGEQAYTRLPQAALPVSAGSTTP